MRNNLFKILAGFVLLFAFSSCSYYQKSMVSAPLSVQVELDMDDLEYIGEVQGSSDQSYTLFIPVGGRRFYRGQTMSQGILGSSNIPLNRGAQNALYDALMQKPNADFVLPFSIESVRHVMFLGSRVEYKVRAKAFRIKTQ
jgi:hypothetical protein